MHRTTSPLSSRHSTRRYVIGADETGYGSWAGPLVVCSAAVPEDWVQDHGINDSKKLNQKGPHGRRTRAFESLLTDPRVVYCLRVVAPSDIDEHGLLVMNKRAKASTANQVLRAIGGTKDNTTLIFDGVYNPIPWGQAMVEADGRIPAVMAASVIAKVYRDGLMMRYDQQFPGYGFANNKGYGSGKEHPAALERLGPCAIHRFSIGRVADAKALAEKIHVP